jgi:hypothetical protein
MPGSPAKTKVYGKSGMRSGSGFYSWVTYGVTLRAYADIATENRSDGGSIPPLGTIKSNDFNTINGPSIGRNLLCYLGCHFG